MLAIALDEHFQVVGMDLDIVIKEQEHIGGCQSDGRHAAVDETVPLYLPHVLEPMTPTSYRLLQLAHKGLRQSGVVDNQHFDRHAVGHLGGDDRPEAPSKIGWSIAGAHDDREAGQASRPCLRRMTCSPRWNWVKWYR